MPALPRFMLDAIDAAGVSTAEFARTQGLLPEKLVLDLTPEEIDGYFLAAWRALDDPGFGLKAGRMLRSERFGLVGFCAMMSSTLGTALTRLARYSRLTAGDEFELVRRGDEIALRVMVAGPVRPYSRAKIDGELMAKFTFARMLTGVEVKLVRACVKGPAPSYAADYAEALQCPVHFDQDEDSITFRGEDLELRLISANPEIVRLFEVHAEEALSLQSELSTEQRVRTALRRVLRGDVPTLGAVASEMCMSTRTLQRKLSEAGLSFSRLVDMTRQEIAQQHVRQNKSSLVEIAYMLGFADPQSFYRAFKRWTGTTPSNYRQPASSSNASLLISTPAEPNGASSHRVAAETADFHSSRSARELHPPADA